MTRRIALAATLALIGLPLVGGGGAILPAQPSFSLTAQEPPPTPFRVTISRGWLGVELVQEVWSVAGEPSAGRVRIASVVPGGPAEAAGLRRGDLVVEVDGRAATSVALNRLAAGLEPGDETRLLVERAGERRTVTVRAAERPYFIGFDGRPVSPDSVHARIRVHMDSVRYVLERAGAPVLRLQGLVGAEGVRLLAPGAEAPIRPLLPDEHGPPIRRPSGLEPLLHRQEFQVDTLVAVIRGERGEPSRIVSIRTTPLDASRAPAAGARAVVVPGREGSPVLAGAVTPRTIIALGQRAVAGAELTDLNPGLASYFGVEEGVLAVEVVEGTPAYEAGLRPGDVIQTVDGERVRNVGEVRAAFARGYADPPVQVGIVREGSQRTLEFSR